ncbi:MAG: hypothetical protein HOW73_51240 [Polyangiaceae bacterium]|nr:hypothetical protein [Polyangiaceae bacterium]
MGRTVIFDSEFFHVEHDAEARVVWVARTPKSSRGDDAFIDVGHLFEVLATIPAAESALVLDARKAVGRNDPDFERRVVPMWNKQFRRFKRAAVLVQTAVGVLQSKRLTNDSAFGMQVFDDEVKLRAWLASGDRDRPDSK